MAVKPADRDAVRFDLFDVETFASGHPHDAYDRMRELQPVWRHDGSATHPPFWALTRYADVQAVSLDGENFTSTRGFNVPTPRRTQFSPVIGRVLGRFMLTMDRPEHDDHRAIVASWLTPAALRELEPRIIQSLNDLMASLEGRQKVDFVTEVAAMVPIRTICMVMGLDPEHEQKVFELTDAVFGSEDPDLSRSAEDASNRYLGLFDYAMEVFEDRRRRPRKDLLTHLVTTTVGGRPLTDDELKSNFVNLLAAGNETTRSTLAGSIVALARFPDQRRLLVEDPSLMGEGVNEILRFVSPVYQMARTALRPVEVGGQMIGEGEKVAMLYGAANRDPSVFEDPHRLDLRRANARKHLTFGVGVHHCLGQRLGLLQVKAILGEFLRRFPDYELDGAYAYVKNNFVAPMKRLPLRLSPDA